MSVEQLSEFDASTTTQETQSAPVSHAEAKEGAGDEEGWIAEGLTASGVPVQWYRHFGTAVPPPTCTDTVAARLDEEVEPLLIVLANEYLLHLQL